MNKDNYLAHYGILGMKWGQRRFQNRDGTRTPIGKSRRRNSYSSDYSETKTLRRKNPKTLTNQEMRKVSERIELEKRYSNSTKNNGIKYVEKVAGITANAVVMSYATKAAFDFVKGIIGK